MTLKTSDGIYCIIVIMITKQNDSNDDDHDDNNIVSAAQSPKGFVYATRNVLITVKQK